MDPIMQMLAETGHERDALRAKNDELKDCVETLGQSLKGEQRTADALRARVAEYLATIANQDRLVDAQEADIKKLDAGIDWAQAEAISYKRIAEQAIAERDRLQEELRLVTAPQESVGAVIVALKAERDRLRGLCNWAAGRMLDAGDIVGHEKVLGALEGE